jgi:phosphate transport system protein
MGEHHTVASFDEDLGAISKLISDMGDLARSMVAGSTRALLNSDNALAQRVVSDDAIMDARQRELDDRAITLIAKRQPMANDLRHIMTVLKIAGDLERIGDLAKNIAKRALAVASEAYPKPLMTGMRHMTEMVQNQLKDVLDALTTRDADKAMKVWHSDQQVDAMYNSLFRELLTYMMEDPRNIGLCTHFLFGAKNIERIGDHTTNIAENVYYLVHGVPLADDRPKGDQTSSTLITPRQ